jgi:sirohydrochlorin cobaltochelatase
MKTTARFRHWLDSVPSPGLIGQAAILSLGEGRWELRHARNAGDAADCLDAVPDWEAWQDLIRTGAAGAFRPLKASPDLRDGWRFGPLAFPGLVLALQFLYPAAIANGALFLEDAIVISPWEETARRQTGRFKIVATLAGEGLAESVQTLCHSHCLKRRLWKPSFPHPDSPAAAWPLVCPEACNWFVSKIRDKIKGTADSAGAE